MNHRKSNLVKTRLLRHETQVWLCAAHSALPAAHSVLHAAHSVVPQREQPDARRVVERTRHWDGEVGRGDIGV